MSDIKIKACYLIAFVFVALALKTNISGVDPNFLMMNSENVTSESYKSFKKYNYENEFNLLMMPGKGKAYTDKLQKIIPAGATVLSDRFTSAHLLATMDFNPIYASPFYDDLSQFCRFLLHNELIIHETINTRPEYFIEMVLLSRVEFILLNKKHLEYIKRSYPALLVGMKSRNDILELLYSDDSIWVFKVKKEQMIALLAEKYKGSKWKLSSNIEWDFFLVSGFTFNATDMDMETSATFLPEKDDAIHFTLNGLPRGATAALLLLVDKNFASTIQKAAYVLEESIIGTEMEVKKEVVGQDGKYRIKLLFNNKSNIEGAKIELKFTSSKKPLKLYDLNIVKREKDIAKL